MKLSELQQFKKIHDDKHARVVRHRTSRYDLWELLRTKRFSWYQNEQKRDVFRDAQYVISFIAEQNKYAKFVGVWKLISKRWDNGKFRYRTEEMPGFEDLKGRLVVRWGEGTRSWVQLLHGQGDKEVFELLPPNYVMDFPGFYNFVLSYDELQTMVKYPDSNREWHRMLSSISGVYVVLDTKSGKQYVGSAYGAGGFWARWKTYAKSPSGGNLLLEKLLKTHPTRHKHFQFSILRVLEPSATKIEVISQEVLTKKKLGSRAFGLNSN